MRPIKPKRFKLKIAILGTGIVHHDSSIAHQLILGQKVKGQGHMVKRCNSHDDTAVRRRLFERNSAVTSLNETTPHGRHELCTLSSAQPLVTVISPLETALKHQSGLISLIWSDRSTVEGNIWDRFARTRKKASRDRSDCSYRVLERDKYFHHNDFRLVYYD